MVCVICIGSNYRQEENVRFAGERLLKIFPSVCFAPAEKTVPVGLQNRSHFLNQVASFTTHKSEQEVKALLKKIEQDAGRSIADKCEEIVRLDIDLLCCDEKVLKPKDWQLYYVEKGIEYLTRLKK